MCFSVQNVFYRPKEKQAAADAKKSKFHQPEGDHLTLLAVHFIHFFFVDFFVVVLMGLKCIIDGYLQLLMVCIGLYVVESKQFFQSVVLRKLHSSKLVLNCSQEYHQPTHLRNRVFFLSLLVVTARLVRCVARRTCASS